MEKLKNAGNQARKAFRKVVAWVEKTIDRMSNNDAEGDADVEEVITEEEFD